MILCCGNPGRGDDGLGPAVARQLVQAGIAAKTVDGHAATLLDAWSGCRWAIIVDAVVTGAPPGTLHRWNSLPGTASMPSSTHGLGVREAMQLGRLLDNIPPSLVVIGVEAQSFEPGAPLSQPVEEALTAVVAQIRAELETLSQERA